MNSSLDNIGHEKISIDRHSFNILRLKQYQVEGLI